MRIPALLLTLALLPASLFSQATFTNPLLPSGADPAVEMRNGFYYYMNTTGGDLTIRKTRDITDLKHAQKKTVWTAPATGPYSKEIWAPELHQLAGKWYIYFAGDAGSNEDHRIFVLENTAADPLEGAWTFKGKLADATDKWAIDPSVFEDKGAMYVIWSGWEGDINGQQNIYIAHLKNPWTIDSPRTRISTPDYPWERVGDQTDHPQQYKTLAHVDVNEGPEILKHGDKLFLIYSASGCWTNYYELGMLTATSGTNLLDVASWKKASKPVFWESPEAGAYGTGHNTFFQSPDGKQAWILYHANPAADQGCNGDRSPRAQPFTWNADGTPNFGRPIPLSTPIPKPSGTPAP